MVNSKSFARVRGRSRYRRMKKEDEKNWKITAPIIRDNGHKGGTGNCGDTLVKDVGLFTEYDFSEREFTRELSRSWKRDKDTD